MFFSEKRNVVNPVRELQILPVPYEFLSGLSTRGEINFPPAVYMKEPQKHAVSKKGFAVNEKG